MTMSIWDFNLTSGSWDWTNQTLMTLWHRSDSGRYPAEKNPSGSYSTSVSVTTMPRLYCDIWQMKASGDSFLSCCYEKNCFSNSATLFKRSKSGYTLRKKKAFSTAMTIKQCKFSVIYCQYYSFFSE